VTPTALRGQTEGDSPLNGRTEGVSVELTVNNGGGGTYVKYGEGKRAPVSRTSPTVTVEDTVTVGELLGWMKVVRRKIEKGGGLAAF
jgi:hypothetical protein